jgi:transcriptional regulator with XRE-family HTH domain
MNMEKISNRVKKIRKIKQRSLHDCAKLLGISKEDYLRFEEGDHALSLPDLELLAIFFEIPPEALIDESDIEIDQYSILEEDKKPIYTSLRSKMIGAQLAFERQILGLSLEELVERTGISSEVLVSYENSTTPVPMDHLVAICDQLDLPIQSLLFKLNPDEGHIDETSEESEIEPDTVESGDEGEKQGVDLYHQIIMGLKSIPKKDQAEIAKMILQKMKTQ